MSHDLPRVYLARHGETEWSLSGRHTGLSDIPLTGRGERNARSLGARLLGLTFDGVFTSPLGRARRTCELAGLGQGAVVDPDLVEVNYGEFEGKRTTEIRQSHPGWYLFTDGCPGGESIDEVAARADRVVARLRSSGLGRIIVFSHGHFLRFLAARWLGLPGRDASRFVLDTAAL